MPSMAVGKPLACAILGLAPSVFIFTFYMQNLSHLFLAALLRSFGLSCKDSNSSMESMWPVVNSSCDLWSHTDHWLYALALQNLPNMCPWFQLLHLSHLSDQLLLESLGFYLCGTTVWCQPVRGDCYPSGPALDFCLLVLLSWHSLC